MFDIENTHIGVSYQNDLPDEIIDDFLRSIESDDLLIDRHSRVPTAYMSMEWAIPTLVIVYLSRPYFESFLKEAGKDHYNLLRQGILKLFKRLFGFESETRDSGYSLIFSIMTHTKNGRLVKFVFPEGISQKEYQPLVEQILHVGLALNNQEVQELENRNKKGTIFLKWSSIDEEWIELIPEEEIKERAKSNSQK